MSIQPHQKQYHIRLELRESTCASIDWPENFSVLFLNLLSLFFYFYYMFNSFSLLFFNQTDQSAKRHYSAQYTYIQCPKSPFRPFLSLLSCIYSHFSMFVFYKIHSHSNIINIQDTRILFSMRYGTLFSVQILIKI